MKVGIYCTIVLVLVATEVVQLPVMERDSDYAQIGLFKRKAVGQTKCDSCNTSYNNAAVPEYCSNKLCNAYIGGRSDKKKKTPTALIFNKNFASVRVKEKGHPTRTFVALGENKMVSFLCRKF